MEVKATLEKPCTQDEYNNFIVEYNHNLGYEIQESNGVVEALGYTSEELFEQARKAKLDEALKKAYEAEENGIVQYKGALFETSTANTSKLTAQFAMMQSGESESVKWLSRDDKTVELSREDIIHLGERIIQYTDALWNIHYLDYKEQIEACTTLDEINEIEISYY